MKLRFAPENGLAMERAVNLRRIRQTKMVIRPFGYVVLMAVLARASCNFL